MKMYCISYQAFCKGFVLFSNYNYFKKIEEVVFFVKNDLKKRVLEHQLSYAEQFAVAHTDATIDDIFIDFKITVEECKGDKWFGALGWPEMREIFRKRIALND